MTEKNYKVGLIHATMNSVQPILEAFQIHAPEVTLLNFMDESLIYELNERGTVTKAMKRRLLDLAGKAEASGVNGILLTCSSFTPVVGEISHLFQCPMLSADLSMLEKAVEMGSHIGVIATVPAAGPTTTALLNSIARECQKSIQVHTAVIPEAFSELQTGNQEKHDELIHRKVQELSIDCDVILFAQFSMARALKTLDVVTKPILTSPDISVKSIIEEITKKEAVVDQC
ncbi:aspartate/glutamate racemase family protein [Domibacillus robiginosus]|uniref:aspartate/glutamate racemase family protein n=1 Tax=Domibacillus robiginosus TaxID=1071054 RepID=UPI000A5E9795|nr:aspartate/glutamate racemase family protein [Domibacillus robiginosus]